MISKKDIRDKKEKKEKRKNVKLPTFGENEARMESRTDEVLGRYFAWRTLTARSQTAVLLEK